ncbi:MAG: phosphoenolpyruvate carboxykinase (ATP) [Bacteroidia bacterium]|nr:phosphoenolpyruvate carboxykinase (ATP) [Bacteroidia bacterium]MDW8235530.1 phosphoenolpyruvate carboxykinase (ATP) [Bacteroidia bacterium]
MFPPATQPRKSNLTDKVYANLPISELIEHTLREGQGALAENGALVVRTGEFTGRAPRDKFVVRDGFTENLIWWGEVNNPLPEEKFDLLYQRVRAYLQNKTLYLRDVYAVARPDYRIRIRVVNELPWHNLFVRNLFIEPAPEELERFEPDYLMIVVPGFRAEPAIDGTRQHNFTILNLSRRLILIGGSAYAGEMKKSIFTLLNYLLPQRGVMPMHCSANVGSAGDVALFFGLSGTGKTTLSADHERRLIGDDEHGWDDIGIFNFEGGCYAKCINLSSEKEPQIWAAIRYGTVVENVTFVPNTRTINFDDASITENTRAAYPLSYIPGAVLPSVGGHPRHIFLLTADAFGVLPPIARLTKAQTMYHFLSGYTAKVAGTEAGIKEPQATFSACFGQAFLPLHPTRYAELFGEKIEKHDVRVWLINTGWTGGPYGIGKRMPLPYTRAMIRAALRGELENVSYYTEPIFRLAIPMHVPGVPPEYLIPRNTWPDPNQYDQQARKLAELFRQNFQKYASFASAEIHSAQPDPAAVVFS